MAQWTHSHSCSFGVFSTYILRRLAWQPFKAPALTKIYFITLISKFPIQSSWNHWPTYNFILVNIEIKSLNLEVLLKQCSYLSVLCSLYISLHPFSSRSLYIYLYLYLSLYISLYISIYISLSLYIYLSLSLSLSLSKYDQILFHALNMIITSNVILYILS